MEQRLISFGTLQKRCDQKYDETGLNDKPIYFCVLNDWNKCTAKNCPVWRKLRSLEEATIFPKKSVFKTIR